MWVCGALLLASAAGAQQPLCPSPQAITPSGANVAVSTANRQYFTYKGQLIPLVGMSHEYICHIDQPDADTNPDRNPRYCTLAKYPEVFAAMKTNGNNVQRLWAIFNHSPGTGAPDVITHAPFPNEQPFARVDFAQPQDNGKTWKWDLRTLNGTYLSNLEKVVCEAYMRDIVIELTLLDPWDGDWETGPFKPINTIAYPDPNNATQMVSPGFAQREHFLSYENGTSDTTSAAKEARKAQKQAVQMIVNKLKRWPNLIWEVANEPDFSTVTPANLDTFENDMIAYIKTYDTTHPIMVNGHTQAIPSPTAPVPGTFAWNLTGANAASLHYTLVTNAQYGAIELQRNSSQTSARANMPLAFNENRFVSGTARTADAIRSEAWEFMLNEGGLFDGYSLDRSALEAQKASTQLKALYNFLVAPGITGGIPTYISNLAAMQQTTCSPSDWCKGLNNWGTSEQGSCTNQAANVYWSTMKSSTDLAVYIHHATQMSGTNGGYAAKTCDTTVPGTGFQNPNFQYRVPQSGCWAAVWIDPATGARISGGLIDRTANTWYSPSSYPYYRHDVVFLASLWRTGTCF
jgi:hypothetical protein